MGANVSIGEFLLLYLAGGVVYGLIVLAGAWYAVGSPPWKWTDRT